MATKKIEIQDHQGNIYYPHSDSSIIKHNNTTVQTQLNTNTTNIAQLSNPNLLINGDFQVWQRGTSFSVNNNGVNITGIYTADRWIVATDATSGTGTLIKTENGVKITANLTGTWINFFTRLESSISKKLIGKKLAYTIKFKNPISIQQIWSMTLSQRNTITYHIADENLSVSDTYKGTFTVKSTDNDKFFEFGVQFPCTIGYEAEIEYIKLEVGSVATPFIPRNYGEELALCQRYYEIVEYVGRDFGATDTIHMSIPYKITKRAEPTRKDSGSEVHVGSWIKQPCILTAFNSIHYCFFELTKPNTAIYNIGDINVRIIADAEIY